MLYFLRFISGFLVLFSSITYASVPTVSSFEYSYNLWYPTAELACAARYDAVAPTATGDYTMHNLGVSPIAGSNDMRCNVERRLKGVFNLDRSVVLPARAILSCPANSVLQGAVCICNAGTTETAGGQCVPPEPDQCAGKQGAVSKMNFTAGWTRDGTLDTPVGKFTAPGVSYQSACVKGCKVAIGDMSSQTAWVSTVPAPSGLYRASVDSDVVGMGESCTESTPEADPAAPYMPCPGFVGQVNGKTTCVGTASTPLPPGSGDTKPIADAVNPNDSKGNPAAGAKPEAGEGSGTGGAGRTPSTGNGTAAGGPAGAAGGTGTTPDGTKDKPGEGKEQAACGAPGQPPCKMDESGTPKKFDGDSKGLDEWKTTMEANRDQIKGAGDGIFGGMNIFFSAPPVASCAPYDLPKDMGSIDPCGVADGVRAVMAYIWALGGLFLCIGWIREAV